MSDRLNIDIDARCSGWRNGLPAAESLAQSAAMAVWQREGDEESEAEMCIVLGDDRLVRELNGKFRGQDKATNVLSFPAEDDSPLEGARLLGDVVLAYDTVAREAREQGKSMSDHFQHLCVHGVLHLLGHDHRNDVEADAMEKLEISILESLSVKNPYAAMKTIL